MRPLNTTRLAGLTVVIVLNGLASAPWAAEQVKSYPITGSSMTELRESLNRQRPVGRDGVPHDAITTWDIRWRYRTDQSSSGCAVSSLEVSLETVVTMPKWVDEADAPASLVERWRTYYAALSSHEDGHKALATAATTAIRQTLGQVPRQPTCADLARAITTAGTRLLEECREKERQYDALTDHGRTQGARFP